ncbi:MAG: hypothetical protein ACYDH9_06470 [Limisphaerales bacterium]
MLEHSKPVLKALCLGLAALLLFQICRIALRKDPLDHLSIPVPPTLAMTSNPQTSGIGTNHQTSGRGTNSPILSAGTNAQPSNSVANPPAPGKGLNLRPPSAPGKKEADLSPAIQARIERIKDSEIFGPVPKPMSLPMALLGIAGKDAFLRAPSGQTGLVREGEELGGIQLLRIGTNRVLVEHEGQKKELTIFSGFGGETLLPKRKENPQ